MPKERNSACAVWDFTLHFEGETTDEALAATLKRNLRKHCKNWCFQTERAGTTHFQGRFSLNNKLREPQVLELKNKRFTETLKPMRLSRTANPSTGHFDYVMKDDTRIDGPWTDQDVIYMPPQCDIKEFRPWQKTVADSLSVFDSRTVHLLHDEGGNIGKSMLCGYLAVCKKAALIPPMADIKDIMRCAMNMPPSSAYLIDIPRGLSGHKLNQLFAGIETIKNGYLYDDRYHFKCKWITAPTIWVFSNFYPNLNVLSRDRWKLWKVDSATQELVPAVPAI